MSQPTIARRAPYVLDMKPGAYLWCACGNSKNQPFCDGSHQGTGFSPQRIEIATEGKVAWCGCKHSQNPPFCDGSHKRLPASQGLA